MLGMSIYGWNDPGRFSSSISVRYFELCGYRDEPVGQSTESMIHRKTGRVLAAVVFLYAALVAGHLGEFWPFSIYPMFSQAGHEWSKSLVMEQEPGSGIPDWQIGTEEILSGSPFALDEVGLNQNDLAEILTKNAVWSPSLLRQVRAFFGDRVDRQAYLIYLAKGSLTEDRQLAIRYTPAVYFGPDTTLVHPEWGEPCHGQ